LYCVIIKLMNQKGFSTLVFIVIAAVLILSVGSFIFLKSTSKNQKNPQITIQSDNSEIQTSEFNGSQAEQNSDEPPLKLKSIGVNFEDFKFTKEKLQFNRLFMGYGFVIPGNETSSGMNKSNPQPTFILPLGTPVRSLVDGVVANMPTLWSGDISIQVTKSGQLEKWVYEVEHVINPKVKVGEKVKFGQIIAEVGSFGNGDPPGFGAVEIGLLHGGGEGLPEHVCPFAFLDDTIKEETFKKMNDLFKSWEEYVGDQTLYDETTIPGCLTLNPIEG
jgi:hypothetical protein